MTEAGVLAWEDRDLFFTDYAIPAVLQIQGDAPVAIQGILDVPYERQEFGPVTLDAEALTFTVKWTDIIAKVRKGDYLITHGKIVNGAIAEAVGEWFTIASAPQNGGAGVCDLPIVRGCKADAAPDTQEYTRPNGILGKR